MRSRVVFSSGLMLGGAFSLMLSLASHVAFAQQPATPPVAEAPKDAAAPSTVTPPEPDASPSPVANEKAQVSPEAVPSLDLSTVPTLVPMAKDPPEVQEVDIPAKPVIVVSGESTWDDSVITLGDAFKKLNAALEKAGKKASGRPVAVFTKTTDDGFSYDAMIPLAEAPLHDTPPPGDGVRYGIVPPGKALRFVHRDSYELISMTYEGAALYMENKNLVGKDQLIEEYVTDITDQADKNTIVNIYVQLAEKAEDKK